MKRLFEPNDTVMYGGHGACTLEEITEKDFGGETKLYYVLRPAFSGSSVFYVPVDSEALTAKIRLVKSASELKAIIHETAPDVWIDDDRTRQNKLKQIVDGGGTDVLIASFKMLHSQYESLSAVGKKLRAADDRYMKDIEKLLLEELSFSYDIQKEELVPFLLEQVEVNIK
ncbi:MAG: hypothetical protein IJA60_07980 [Clostridia bacterium]|nr:hypothetical protein [Clostridia bacterium]